jgi:hypothetical protein
VLFPVKLEYPVVNPQMRRFTASRRAYDGSHLVFNYVNIVIEERLMFPVMEIQIPDGNLDFIFYFS